MQQAPQDTSASETRSTAGIPPHSDAPPMRTSRGGVTFRSVLIGLILLPITIYWITVTEVRWYTLDGTSLPLFIQPIFFLFFLCLLNLLVKSWRGRAWLEQGELLVVYIMLAMACVFAGHDMLQNLF